ncbi:MAG: phosphoribosyltransferase [Bacteroidia bacterium]|nr:phosphoribosyltransferase [Bacteroidia bacterium]
MTAARTNILNHKQINQMIIRMAYQVYESNMDASDIVIAGVAERGGFIGELLFKALKEISPAKVNYISLNDAVPKDFKGKTVVLTDDVLNTGATLINIMGPLVNAGVVKLEVAVLADRNHRLFPVHADYKGISMATTLQEHIFFDNSNSDDLQLYLV